MALENNDLLETYKRKHTIIFLCGMPASGKSEFGKYLQDKHGYTYIPMEEKVWPDNKLRLLWNDVFNSPKRQYNKVEKFVCYLYDNYENVVLDWGFPMTHIPVVGLLKRQWCEIIWFVCGTTIARQRFIKRSGTEAVSKFDSQVKDIKENVQNIEKSLNPKVIDVLKEDKSSKTKDEIYMEFSAVINTS
jgi:shikimate kinase